MATATPFAIDGTTTINQIVAQYPNTLPVFAFFGLDTCCGGALPLEEAVTRHGLSLTAVVHALQEATK